MKKLVLVIALIVIVLLGGFAAWWFGTNQNKTVSNIPQTTSSVRTVTPPPSTNAKTISTIKSNWVTFFNGATPASEKIALLQNGSQFSSVIQSESQSPAAKATTASVSNVQLNGTTATVTYTIAIDNVPSLSNQKGQAVLTNGSWLISDTAFCGLLRLSGNTPPNCPKT